MPRTLNLVGILVTLTAGVVTVAGCGSQLSSQGQSRSVPSSTVVPDSPGPSETVAPPLPADEIAIAAYRAMWAAYALASYTSYTSNPDDPAIRRMTTGQALEAIVAALARDRAAGVRRRGGVILDPRVEDGVTSTGDTVRLIDCVDDTFWTVFDRYGLPIDDATTGSRHTTAEVSRVGLAWRVSVLLQDEAGSC